MEGFVQELGSAIAVSDGKTVGDLLTITTTLKVSELGHLKRLSAPLLKANERSIILVCKRNLPAPWDDITGSFLSTLKAIQQHDWNSAFESHLKCLTNFGVFFEGDNSNTWIHPLRRLGADLRQIARRADRESRKTDQDGTCLNKAENEIKKGFTRTANDRNNDPSTWKKGGALCVANTLFKMYFELNIRMSMNIIRVIESGRFPPLEIFPKAHRVEYKFHVGCISLFQDDFEKAESYLDYAFQHCPRRHTHNKRLILQYLIPVKLLQGKFPSSSIVDYVSEYQVLCDAVKTGNVKTFQKAMHDNQEYFIKNGVYLLLEKLKFFTLRNLFRKVWLCLNKVNQIPLARFKVATDWLQCDLTLEEVECLLANLIYKGLIKAYIHHGKSVLVLSKTNPFPAENCKFYES